MFPCSTPTNINNDRDASLARTNQLVGKYPREHLTAFNVDVLGVVEESLFGEAGGVVMQREPFCL